MWVQVRGDARYARLIGSTLAIAMQNLRLR